MILDLRISSPRIGIPKQKQKESPWVKVNNWDHISFNEIEDMPINYCHEVNSELGKNTMNQ